MNLTDFTLKKSRLSIFVFVCVALLGLSTFLSLPQDSMPAYTVRVANIITTFPGAGPERIEQLITEKVEQKVQEIPEIKELKSTSRSNISIVTVTLQDDIAPQDLQPIWDRIRRKMETTDLPNNAKWELDDDGIGEVFGIVIGITSDLGPNGQPQFSYSEMEDLADELRDQIIALEAAAKVEISGLQEEQIFIEYHNAQLKKYGLTAAQLQSIIGSTNILYSGGAMNLGDERIVLEPSGNYDELEDLEKTIVQNNNGNIVYLGDVAAIRRGYKTPPSSLVKVDQKPTLALSVSLKKGANVVVLGEQVNTVVEAFTAELPYGLSIHRLASMDSYVDGEVNNFVSNLIQTVLIVLVVMLFFLGVRTGLIIASLVPMVILATFVWMGVFGQGVNQVTLAALIMALGMMVDNGVVVSETVLVKLQEGLTKRQAVVSACRELFVPLLISTLTTSVAFLSFYLAESTMGDIVGPLFVVISIALLCSWFFSLTMITMLCYYFLKVDANKKESWLDKIIIKAKMIYKKWIGVCLAHKRSTLAAVLLMFILSIILFRFIPFIFFPDSERNLITVDINLPQGTRIERTMEVVEDIEVFMNDRLRVNDDYGQGVVGWSAFVGEGPYSYDLGYNKDQPNSNYAHLLVNTTSGDANGGVIHALDDYCFASFPEADIRVSRLGGGGGGVPIEIKVSGAEADNLMALAEEIRVKLLDVNGTKNVKDNWGPKIKKIAVNIDPVRAQNSGMTNEDIALSLYTSLNGFNVGDFREDDQTIHIFMRDENFNDVKVENLGSINVYSQRSGRSVPLSQIAEIDIQWQNALIVHSDLKRTISVTAEIDEGGNASEIMAEVQPWLQGVSSDWPDGYNYEIAGESKDSAENMGAVAKYLPLSGFLILLLLIIQFNSLRKTFIIVCTIPLGIIGVVFGLILLQSYFGFFAFLGMISLAGIVINNGIVLMDRIDIERNEGLSLLKAVEAACISRFRPIVLTTFTTVLGMIPLYLGGGLMWEPMAASIMVGLLFGTLITLIFVPVLYVILFQTNGKLEPSS